jgi:RNA polymerase sigma-70 factor (ECF subfamily)
VVRLQRLRKALDFLGWQEIFDVRCNHRVVFNDLMFKGASGTAPGARYFRKRWCQWIVTVIVPDKPADRAAASAVETRLKGLLQLALEGNAAAYASFLEMFSGYLRGMLRRRLRSYEDDVEDVLQEVLFALHNGLHTYRNQVPLTAWAAAIVRHKVADFLRAHAHREALHDPIEDEMELFATSETESLDAQRDIDTLLEQLPERQRVPIEYIRLRGMSVSETAKLTGLSESAVKVAVHRGIKALSRLIRG